MTARSGNSLSTELSGQACQCSGCGLVFRSIGGFDKHRVGRHGTPERRCLTADELTALGMRPGAKGRWSTPWTSTERPQFWARSGFQGSGAPEVRGDASEPLAVKGKAKR